MKKEILMLIAIFALFAGCSDNSSSSVSVGPEVSAVVSDDDTTAVSSDGKGSSSVDTQEQKSSSSVDSKKGTGSSSVDKGVSSSSTGTDSGTSSSSVDFVQTCKDEMKAIEAADTTLIYSVETFYVMQRSNASHTLDCVTAMYPTMIDDFFIKREVVYIQQCGIEIECPLEAEYKQSTKELKTTVQCDKVSEELANWYGWSCKNMVENMKNGGFYVEEIEPIPDDEIRFYE